MCHKEMISEKAPTAAACTCLMLENDMEGSIA